MDLKFVILFVAVNLLTLDFFCVNSQTITPGGCEKPVQQDFQINKYLGVWYEIQRSYFIQENEGICISARYSDLHNGSIEVYNSRVTKSGEFHGTLGYANLADPQSTEGRLSVNFPSVGSYNNSSYWVMDTDYNNYSIVWSCRPYRDGESKQILWFLARESNPSKEIRDYVQDSMIQLGLLDNLRLETTKQEGCYLIV